MANPDESAEIDELAETEHPVYDGPTLRDAAYTLVLHLRQLFPGMGLAIATGKARVLPEETVKRLQATADRVYDLCYGTPNEQPSAERIAEDATRRVCDECGYTGTTADANQEFDVCTGCEERDVPVGRLVCPKCGEDRLVMACPDCGGRFGLDYGDEQPSTPEERRSSRLRRVEFLPGFKNDEGGTTS